MITKYRQRRNVCPGRAPSKVDLGSDSPFLDAHDLLQGLPDFQRLVVGVDPAATSHADSDETGIIVAGLTVEGLGVVLEDVSGVYSPQEWAQRVVSMYHTYRADRVVAEVNKGGDMVASLLRVVDPTISFKGVHATKNKFTRAEPIAALYEQGKVYHIRPFPELEEQLCNYVPGKSRSSPDRMDALVWALTDLMLTPVATSVVRFRVCR